MSCDAVIARFHGFVATCGAPATRTFVYDGVKYDTCDLHDPERPGRVPDEIQAELDRIDERKLETELGYRREG